MACQISMEVSVAVQKAQTRTNLRMWSRCIMARSQVGNAVSDGDGNAHTFGMLQAVKVPQLERRNYGILLGVPMPCICTHASFCASQGLQRYSGPL